MQQRRRIINSVGLSLARGRTFSGGNAGFPNGYSTGGILNPSLKTIGREKVAVPEYFYKILMDDTNGKYRMIAFMIPNEKSDKPLYSFVVSVDSLEKITGIDFFPKLEDKTENSLEKNSNYKSWSF